MIESIRNYFERKREERIIRRERLREELKPEVYALVKMLSEFTIVDGMKGQVTIYYDLYESNKGRRKVEVRANNPSIGDALYIAKQLNMYNEKIYRWMKGRVDPDIPRYDQVSEEDVANLLKGKI